MKQKPYFMENKEWYYFDEKDWCLKLTDKAPKDAIDSYKEFYRESYNENGALIKD